MTLAQSQFNCQDLYDLYANGAPRAANAIPKRQQSRCVRLLDALEAATKPADLALPGYGFRHKAGRYLLTVDARSVITFRWASGRPLDIDYS